MNPSQIPPTEALPARAVHVRDGVSVAGRAVRLSRDCGTYQGARPYYTVAYDLRRDPRPGHQPSAKGRSARDHGPA